MRAALITLSMVVALTGCKSAQGGNAIEKRAYAQTMRDDTLVELYKQKPEVKAEIANAPGYAVFSNLETQLLFMRSGHGYGIVTDKRGNLTYMTMLEIGGGIGLRVNDLKVVFVFRDKRVMDKFTSAGWQWDAEADAAAHTDPETGLGVGTTASLVDPIKIYRLESTGVAISTALVGTRYSRDDELN